MFDWKEIYELENKNKNDNDDDNDDEKKKIPFRLIENPVQGASAILAPWRSILIEAFEQQDQLNEWQWCLIL